MIADDEQNQNGRKLDERVLEAARSGDPRAIETLLSLVRRRLENTVRSKFDPQLGDKLRRSDILQSTYLRVLTALPKFRGNTEPELFLWIRRILVRTMQERARYFRAERRRTGGGASNADTAMSSQPTPSANAAIGEELLRVAQAMSRLPKDQRQILTLHLDPEQTHAATPPSCSDALSARPARCWPAPAAP